MLVATGPVNLICDLVAICVPPLAKAGHKVILSIFTNSVVKFVAVNMHSAFE